MEAQRSLSVSEVFEVPSKRLHVEVHEARNCAVLASAICLQLEHNSGGDNNGEIEEAEESKGRE
jgi:hypothetical protein